MTRAILLLLFSVHTASAGLASYSSLVVADPPSQGVKSNSVRVTYLGTNGYRFETAGHTLLVDPYFSRISLARAALGWPVRPNHSEIDGALAHIGRHADAIVVTHGHFDHLLDVPIIMNRTGAELIGSRTAVELAERAGTVPVKCRTVRPGMTQTIGPWRITALPASHDRLLFMGIPFNGASKGTAPPVRAGDWICGEPLSYLIAANGMKIFVDSGGTPAVLPSSGSGPVDLAILGMALPDSRARFAATVWRLRPRYILPSHQDNFFLPLNRGFQFATLTDFPFVRLEHDQRHLPGQLILLDYFQPWTLPAR